jgi:hypothetical protein
MWRSRFWGYRWLIEFSEGGFNMLTWLLTIAVVVVMVVISIVLTYKIKEKIRVKKIVSNYINSRSSPIYREKPSHVSDRKVSNEPNRSNRPSPSPNPNPSPKINVNTKQTCSYCRKKNGKLSFYSKGNGSVIGLCNVCKPQAERQALKRI